MHGAKRVHRCVVQTSCEGDRFRFAERVQCSNLKVHFLEERTMNVSAINLPAAVLAMAFGSGAYAVTCVDGVRRAECETAAGVVEVRKPVEPVPVRGVEVAPARAVEVAPARAVEVAPAREAEVRDAEVRTAADCRIVDGRRVCR
ncbi:MAG: hypothetical protein HT579_16835 [Candidatus Accumulibacter similis]|nr:MAG: hypothetical protein HT579_16835 [Candidatus Accumulibacter similis]